MSLRFAGVLLIVAAACMCFDSGAARFLAAAGLAAAAVPLVLSKHHLGRLVVSDDFELQTNGKCRVAVVCDPPGQRGRTTLLIQSGTDPIADILRRAFSPEVNPRARSIILDTFENSAGMGLGNARESAVSLCVEPDEWRGLVVRDKEGRTRLLAGVDGHGTPRFTLLDENGRETVVT